MLEVNSAWLSVIENKKGMFSSTLKYEQTCLVLWTR